MYTDFLKSLSSKKFSILVRINFRGAEILNHVRN